MPVLALVPARNEADKIGRTVKALLDGKVADYIAVVDDASIDGTAEEAEAAGAHVTRLTENLGKGGAVNSVLERLDSFDVVLLIDGDVAETAAEAAKILTPVENGEADMAVAIFPKKEGTGGFGLALGLARRLIRWKTGFTAAAPLSGQRALNDKAVKAAFPFATNYGMETAMTIDVLQAGLRVVEVPAAFAHSYTYRDVFGFRHRGRQFIDILKVMFRKRRL